MMIPVEIRHFHLFCGLGGGAKGFNKANPRVGNLQGRMRCIGGVDVDPAAIRDARTIAGMEGTVLDLFDRSQYVGFHGHEPPRDWREATPADIQRAAGNEAPHIVFLSAPCKGFSGLLSESRSRTVKYIALNRLTLRGVMLMLEAWKDDPPWLVVFENVPRIATRGRGLLDQIVALFQAYGYAVNETDHDCGELGGLGQSRKRFLLVARHLERVPAFLYQPPKRALRAVGEILGRMPLPGDPRAGPMHRVPALQWKTWVRLAFVEAGSDWRSLNQLAIEDGFLRDFRIEREYNNGTYGVNAWGAPVGAITSRGTPSTGKFSVADPRFGQSVKWHDGQAYGVRTWGEATGAIAGQQAPGQGAYAVADPRAPDGRFNKYRVTPFGAHSNTVIAGSTTGEGAFAVADPRTVNEFGGCRIISWGTAAGVVTGQRSPGSSAQSVADPRLRLAFNNVFRIVPWASHSPAVAGPGGPVGGLAVADPRSEPLRNTGLGVQGWSEYSVTVRGESFPSNGAFAIADPRVTLRQEEDGDKFRRSLGVYGVLPWEASSGAVAGRASYDNGPWSVADPRLPALDEKLVAIIRARDGTWHRPFTTLDLAALQSLVDPDDYAISLDGKSDSAHRERIGNAVPPNAAEAIGQVMGETILLAMSGETFALSSTPIWVRNVAVALAVDVPRTHALAGD